MKNCKYSKYLSEYVYQELDPHMKRLVEEHLPHCSACKEELNELTFIKQLSCSMPEEEIPVGLHERIMEKVRSEPKSRNRLNWMRYSVIPVAAALLIFFISQGIPNVISRKSANSDDAIPKQNLIMATPGETLTDAPPVEQGDAEIAGSERRDTAKDLVNEEVAPAIDTDHFADDGAGGNIKSDTDNRYSYSAENDWKETANNDENNKSIGTYEIVTYIAEGLILIFGPILLVWSYNKKKKLKKKNE